MYVLLENEFSMCTNEWNYNKNVDVGRETPHLSCRVLGAKSDKLHCRLNYCKPNFLCVPKFCQRMCSIPCKWWSLRQFIAWFLSYEWMKKNPLQTIYFQTINYEMRFLDSKLHRYVVFVMYGCPFHVYILSMPHMKNVKCYIYAIKIIIIIVAPSRIALEVRKLKMDSKSPPS